jgi:hypothetical protein
MTESDTKFTTPYPVRLTPELLDEIEAYRNEQPGGSTLPRSQVLRMLIEIGLQTVKSRDRGKSRKARGS